MLSLSYIDFVRFYIDFKTQWMLVKNWRTFLKKKIRVNKSIHDVEDSFLDKILVKEKAFTRGIKMLHKYSEALDW